MIAIAESGSTKCHWLILDDNFNLLEEFKTIGFNPDFHSQQLVKNVLLQNPEVLEINAKIKQLYFYGAGCSSSKLKKVINNGLAGVFPNAKILVDHDLLAAAYSLYNNKPVIACILGTGSNSCYFDGKELLQSVPSLGFLIGDEGSGGYFGKKLLRDYYYGLLPKSMEVDFRETYGWEWEETRKKLYQTKDPNVFSASLMPFLAKHIERAYVSDMIESGFSRFVDVHVKSFSNSTECEISFVGSVAFYFQCILKKVLADKGLRFGTIIQSPASALVNYHIKNILHTEKEATKAFLKSEATPTNHPA